MEVIIFSFFFITLLSSRWNFSHPTSQNPSSILSLQFDLVRFTCLVLVFLYCKKALRYYKIRGREDKYTCICVFYPSKLLYEEVDLIKPANYSFAGTRINSCKRS
jgi:hypothetical protein